MSEEERRRRFSRQNVALKLGEAPDGVYRLVQHLDADGNFSTLLVPIRKRWWWFGSWRTDRHNVELCEVMARMED